MRVVIRHKLHGMFLQRRGSYGVESWTHDLQEADVMTETGAQRRLTSMCRRVTRFDNGKKRENYELVPVEIRRTDG